jgi:hypothetical protein
MSIDVAADAHGIPILVRLNRNPGTCGPLRTICGMCAFLVMLHISIPRTRPEPRYQHSDARHRAYSATKHRAFASSGATAVEAAPARCVGGADSIVSRCAACERADGIDLSARGGAGRALGKPDQEPLGRCAQGGGGEAGVGCERQVARGGALTAVHPSHICRCRVVQATRLIGSPMSRAVPQRLFFEWTQHHDALTRQLEWRSGLSVRLEVQINTHCLFSASR